MHFISPAKKYMFLSSVHIFLKIFFKWKCNFKKTSLMTKLTTFTKTPFIHTSLFQYSFFIFFLFIFKYFILMHSICQSVKKNHHVTSPHHASMRDASFCFFGRRNDRLKDDPADDVTDPLKVDFLGIQKNRRIPFFCGTGLPESLSELSLSKARTPKPLFTLSGFCRCVSSDSSSASVVSDGWYEARINSPNVSGVF